jgi:hypothetical protein
MLLLFVSIGAGLLAAFISLDWFFANAEETDSSMAESQRPFMPWWGSKFGIWTTFSTFIGVGVHVLLPNLFPQIFVPWHG